MNNIIRTSTAALLGSIFITIAHAQSDMEAARMTHSEDLHMIVLNLTLLLLIFAGLSVPILVLVVQGKNKRELARMWHQQCLAALEKGMEPPAMPSGLLEAAKPRTASQSDPSVSRYVLLVGMLLVAVGIGLVSTSDRGLSHFGRVLLFSGIATVLFYWIAGRKKASSLPPPPEAR